MNAGRELGHIGTAGCWPGEQHPAAREASTCSALGAEGLPTGGQRIQNPGGDFAERKQIGTVSKSLLTECLLAAVGEGSNHTAEESGDV